MSSEDRVIVAIDVNNRSEALGLCDRIPGIRIAKIGSILFSAEGPAILTQFQKRRIQVFLDLKFHDIPNTVAGAIESVCQSSAIAMITIHASGGRAMIRAAREAIDRSQAKQKPKLLAVTMLTSLSAEMAEEVGFRPGPLLDQVHRLARLSTDSGADGIVCSSKEVGELRKLLPKEKLLVVPGIRPATYGAKDDQQRVATPKEAIQWGASHLVVGRPITDAKDPKAAFDAICHEIEGA